MKRLKFPVLFAAIMIALVSAFAFNTAPVKKTGTLVTYYYDATQGQSFNALKDHGNWSTSGSSCNASGNDVCSMPAANINDLYNILDNAASRPDIVSAANGFKN